MKRKLTLAMLLSLSAASPLALALGLGEADVRSTLNAPLRATLPLTDAAGIQAGLLNVSVADERAFAAAGLPRTPLAASVRLAVEQRQGRLVVDLTTERPVREPWIDLLLRFDWPGGQQLREVTLLLDPPDYDQMPALVAGSRRTAAASVSVSAPQRDTAPAQVSVPRPSGAPTGSGDPSWVRSGDTLWAIAGRLRPDSGISMNQMMISLVEANPEAFPSGNINAMRAGFSLVVPSREAIAARSTGDAERIVAEMNRAWANRGSGAPARVALGSPATPQPTVSVDPAPTEAAAPSPQEVSPSPSNEPVADAPEVPEPVEEVAVTDAASAEEPETPRLTLLTDAQLAAEGVSTGDGRDDDAASDNEIGDGLGEAGETSGSPGSMADADLLATLYGEGELTSDERLVRLESEWLERRDALEAVQGERDQLQEELTEMRDELATMREQLAALAAGGTGADGPGPGGVAPLGGQADETPWWGAIYQGDVDRNMMLGGAGLAALLALWLAVRRRRHRENAEPAAVGPGPVRVTVPGSQAPGQFASASPQAASPVAPSVQGSLPQAEAISEADIFMAYGRYDQARELLETNLSREPERDDLRLKLLNVHLEQGSREEAENEATRLSEGGNPAVRDEVKRLLTRYGLGSAAAGAAGAIGASVTGGERAVFDKPSERPPRVFDETTGGEPGSPEQDAKDLTEDGTDPVGAGPASSTSPVASTAQVASDEAPYRRPKPRDVAPASGDEAPRPAVEPEPDPVEPETFEVATRRLEDGREIIDYRPPALSTSPAPKGETPMQPSIDFSPDDLGLGEKGAGFDDGSRLDRAETSDDDAAEETLPHEWEVEEVSFPSLEADNGSFSPSAAPDRLAEARRWVEAGDGGRARQLLNELGRSDDPAIRDEAAALLRRLDA
ncbi:MAG: FimV/HubP family polar landmark protein [Halomonas sp.]|uniref:FimV/HubP family polar landmark protein n=1 Tax=Halomonas sp. TaxID=1486246 RepID=UPI00397083D3